MYEWKEICLILLPSLFAFLFGLMITKVLINRKKQTHSQQVLKTAAGITDKSFEERFCCDGLALKILLYTVKVSYSLVFASKGKRLTEKFVKNNKLPQKIKMLAYKANMPAIFGNYAYRELQARLSFGFICIGCVAGLIFSTVLSIICIFIGLICGMMAVSWAMKKEIDARLNLLEKSLPEMLEVVSLGLRSGLTFDRSFSAYCENFKTTFAKECKITQKKWEGGLKNREEALRDLAKSYDSDLFNRVIENIIRSLRFGSALVDSLEDAAIEARNSYKAKQEEIVAKAPVKMMIPTGTLILPAMLLLVLGPVLLELIGGF